MGWMGGSSSTSSVSPEQKYAQGTAMNFAVNAANQPFQQYQGPWTAGFRPELLQAGNMLSTSGNVGVPQLNEAAGGARAAMGFQPMMIGSQNTTSQNTTSRDSTAQAGSQFMGNYFNPYIDLVAGGLVDNMGRARTQQLMSDEDKAIAAGAYGGSRHGVMDSLTTRGFYDTLGQNLNNVFSQGFTTAANLGMADAQRFTDVDRANADRLLNSDQGNANRLLSSDQGNANRRLTADQSNQSANLSGGQLRLAGSQALGNIGDTLHDNTLQSALGLQNYGQYVQGYDQQALDRDRERFNEWRDYPMRQSQIINAAANGGIQGGGGTTTQNKGLDVAGGVGTAMGAMALVPGIGWAGAAGLGLLSAMSDRNVKSDVRRLKSEDDVLEGVKRSPASTWRYDPRKGGPDDGGAPHIGPMAQDVKRNLGIGDGHAIPVVDMMGAHHAAISALAKKVAKIKATDVKIKRVKGKK